MDPSRFLEQKVVINTLEKGVIKGYLQTKQWKNVEELLESSNEGRLPDVLEIRSDNGEGNLQVPLAEVKAVFFVKSFEGKGHRKDVRFYTQAPIFHGVWVRAEFHDGEILEGIVSNTLHHLVHGGFFITPSDPSGNNQSVYVLKSALKDYRILGVRNINFDLP